VFFILFLQPSVTVRVVNPQPSNGHFQIAVPFYNGDNCRKVMTRIARMDRNIKGLFFIHY
jgi:leucyl-tRNA synthetase